MARYPVVDGGRLPSMLTTSAILSPPREPPPALTSDDVVALTIEVMLEAAERAEGERLWAAGLL